MKAAATTQRPSSRASSLEANWMERDDIISFAVALRFRCTRVGWSVTKLYRSWFVWIGSSRGAAAGISEEALVLLLVVIVVAAAVWVWLKKGAATRPSS